MCMKVCLVVVIKVTDKRRNALIRVGDNVIYTCCSKCGCGGMVDTPVLGTGAERRVGSSPTTPTNKKTYSKLYKFLTEEI